MNINAKYFGSVSYEDSDSIHIINGLIGFESHTDYLPIPFQDEDDSLISLQCLDDEKLSFILMNPFGILADYSPSLSDEELKELDAEASEDLSYYVVCVMRDSVAESTVNLKAPLVVNARTRQARQIILDQSEYTFRHVLGDMMKEES